MDILLLENEMLRLPTKERARLAHRLLESLDDLSQSEVEAVWVDEAQRRAVEIDNGTVVPISAEELETRIQASLR